MQANVRRIRLICLPKFRALLYMPGITNAPQTFFWLLAIFACPVWSGAAAEYDLMIRNGTIYDGSGKAGQKGDLAVNGQNIAAIGNLEDARGKNEIDAAGLAVAPGFINMLSWATDSLIKDGRSQSDLRQGVTLEIFGEGGSMGPLNDAMKKESIEEQGDIKYPIEWTTLAEYHDYLVKRVVSCTAAS